MKRLASIALLCLSLSIHAAPVVLKCVTSEGREAVDLTIDVEKMEMSWGVSKYDINYVDDTHISAYERHSWSVGGEVWVIDRRTGEYKRATIGMTKYAGQMEEESQLTASIYTGKCVKQLF